MDLKGKVILVVGGAAGIGKATAELCASRGASVIVADMNEVEGRQTAIAANGLFIPVNVANEQSVQQMAAQVAERYDHVDVLIQAAGILKGAFVPLEDFTLETWRTVMEVNATGSFLCSKAITPLLEKTGRGVILLVSSGAAQGGSSSYAYGSSKGAVTSLGITLSAKLAPHNIRVNVIHPGNIRTAKSSARSLSSTITKCGSLPRC